jgi:hypothetical protein
MTRLGLVKAGEGGKGSAPLTDMNRLMAPHPSLRLCRRREARGAVEIMSHLGLVKAAKVAHV